MKNALVIIALSAVLGACASRSVKSANNTYTTNRVPANSDLAEVQALNIIDVISLNSGFWDVKRGEDSYFGRYRAYIIASQPDQDYNTLYVFAEREGLKQPAPSQSQMASDPKTKLEKQNDDSKFSLVAKNGKFVWGSDWAGTEPTLTVNQKGSLVINTLNEGIGRESWNQQVVVRLNPETNAMEFIGFEYNTYDKINLSSRSCSYNFNTGIGVVKTFGSTVDENGKEIRKPKKTTKKLKVSTAKINLNDLTEPSELPALKDCFNF